MENNTIQLDARITCTAKLTKSEFVMLLIASLTGEISEEVKALIARHFGESPSGYIPADWLLDAAEENGISFDRSAFYDDIDFDFN